MTRLRLASGTTLRAMADGDVVRITWQDAVAGTSRTDQCDTAALAAWLRAVVDAAKNKAAI